MVRWRRVRQAASGPGVSAFVLSASASLDHSLVTTAGGDVWSWGRNSDGQLGTGCGVDEIGRVRPPQLARGIPAFSTSQWRDEQKDVRPAALLPLNLSTLSAQLGAMLATPILPSMPELPSIAGPAAPCRAACEANASVAQGDGGCAGFTFPFRLDDPFELLSWRNCSFYAAPRDAVAGGTGASTTVATVRDDGVALYLYEVRTRGNAAAAAAGSRHSLVAVGLKPAERCPKSGALNLKCGGNGAPTSTEPERPPLSLSASAAGRPLVL